MIQHAQHPKRSSFLRANLRNSAGFSLVEVTLSIGVLACAVLPLVALMPQGVDTLHASIRQNAEARIQQEIVGRLTSTDWAATNDLAKLDQSRWFFTDYGAPVEDAADAHYTVVLEINNPSLPGAVGAHYFLRTAVMKITDLPEAAKPFEDPAKYRRYVATVAKMDKASS